MTKRRQKSAKFTHERTYPAIEPKTQHQADYIDALRLNPQVVVLGPAGTGKTFIAGNHAADKLRQNRYGRLVITRPNVPGGRSLGFFPGSLEEKIAPWVAPLVDVIRNRIGGSVFDTDLKNGKIEIIPFEVMRGRSWDDSLIILDEAQNTTPQEMKLFLTRIGEDSQVIINGDVSQTDLKETSGLHTILSLIKKHDLPVPVIEFTMDDIVRSDICAMWVKAFHAERI